MFSYKPKLADFISVELVWERKIRRERREGKVVGLARQPDRV